MKRETETPPAWYNRCCEQGFPTLEAFRCARILPHRLSCSHPSASDRCWPVSTSLTAARMAACLPDAREPGKVVHPLVDLVRQRVFGLACGYADANDAARLANDPVYKLLLDRDPVDGAALASQPTLSRFENAVGPRDVARLGVAGGGAVIA